MIDEEGKLNQEMARGAQARAILEHSLFKEAVEKVEDSILEKWKSSPIRDEEGQFKLRLQYQALQAVVAHIKDVLETGKLASHTMEERRNLAQRTKAALAEFRR